MDEWTDMVIRIYTSPPIDGCEGIINQIYLRIYLSILTVAMPVFTIEQASVFPSSNCIIPLVANK